MKRILIAMLFLMVSGNAYAIHTILRDASNLSAGTLSNERLDPSSVTLLGPSLDSDDITGTIPPSKLDEIPASKLEPGVFTKPYDLIIGTKGATGASFQGDDRIPFVSAIASATTGGGKASIFVRRGTYTIQNVESDGIDWVLERGAVLRQANNASMLKIVNGKFEGGVIITTATAAASVTTPTIVLGNGAWFKDVRIEQAQTNMQCTTFNEATGYIQIGHSQDVRIDGIDVSTYTNFTYGSGTRNSFIGILNSTNVWITNSKIRGGTLAPDALDALVKIVNSDVNLRDNYIWSGGNACVFSVDLLTYFPSRLKVIGNEFHDVNGDTAIIDATLSSAAVYMGNTIVAHSNTSIGFDIRGGGYGNNGKSMFGTLISGNYMYANDDKAKSSSSFVTLDSDTNQSIVGVLLEGNMTSFINTFESEANTIVNIGFRDNRKNGVLVTDQN